ncbi:MAG TPA: 4-alpha-glucanotransferase [Burkholderiaceae bacterium]|nr:4-alpha-glucanotransferase [Burkholderiaceae bacterium]
MSTLDHRRSGIVLHPTALPGPHGSGDFGPGAYHFVDWLAQAAQSVWQVLPLTPIGPGNSPYAGASAFAGNPLLVALEPLIERGWLAPVEAAATAHFDPRRVDFGRVIAFRRAQLAAAAAGFFAHASGAERDAFEAYCAREAGWLDDYALFMALDEAQQHTTATRTWPHWDGPLARREPVALASARRRLAEAVRFWQFVQWCFDSQWAALKAYANGKGIHVMGDLPIFVAHHSADCWARPELYHFDERFEPLVVAGVPPDYFSATGQRWGSLLYRWDVMEREHFAWWIARMRRQLAWADLVRIDHFRGFAGYWEIPAASPTAIDGRWVPAPGAKLFHALGKALGHVPVVAEDLGVITADVVELLEGFALPGMRVLQFAFAADASNAYLPHNYVRNTVVYTGTHDNDTARGWWDKATAHERGFATAYLGCDATNVHSTMVRAASASVAQLALFPLQDVLGLDGAHRMNTPGQTGCWEWRFTWDLVAPDAAQQLASVSAAHGRAPLGKLKLAPWPAGIPLPS